MYNYVFHYNPYTELWNAIPRELYNQYWNDAKIEGVLSSKRLDVLYSLLTEIEKDANFINTIKIENDDNDV